MSSTDWLRARAARWSSARTMERVIEPALADVQTEYEAAAQDGRIWRSRWIWITGHAAFLKVLAWVTAERALDVLRGATARDRHALGRTFAVFAAVTALGTGLLTLPPLLAESSRPPGTIWLGILLIPQAVPLSIPVGLTFGILWGLGRVAASRRSRALVFVAAVVSCVVSFATLAWVMPAANQAYRQSIAGVTIAKGANELTLVELERLIESGQYATIGMGSPRGRRSVAMAYHVRWALSLAPFVLSVFALVWTRRQRGRVSIVAVGCAMTSGYYLVLFLAERAHMFDREMSAVVAAWAANVTFVALSALLSISSRDRLHENG
jgi:lipopolysaccharide export LptBFGC system permease protein LptF